MKSFICDIGEGAIRDYCSFQPELVEKFKEEFPLEFEEANDIRCKTWVLMGKFIAFLKGQAKSFHFINLIVFDYNDVILNYFKRSSKWRSINEILIFTNQFQSKKSKLKVCLANNFPLKTPNFLMDVFCYVDLSFLHHYSKKMLHLESGLLIDINYGYESEYYLQKEDHLRNNTITYNTPTLKFLSMCKICANLTIHDTLKHPLLYFFKLKSNDLKPHVTDIDLMCYESMPQN